MSRKSWHLSRRTLLRGAGVAAAMPYLHAMEKDVRAAQRLGGGEPPKRLVYVYFPNGCSLPGEKDEKNGAWRWFPSGSGSGFELTEVLAPLKRHRAQMSVFGGLSHPMSRQLLGHLAGDTWLTAGDLRGDQYKNRVSVDQVAARELQQHTRLPSLVLSTDGGVGYKSRLSTLSFDVTGRPIPSEHRQRAIFERYFAPEGGPSGERRKSLARGRKIVDLVLEDSRRLRGKLGERDREKLDEYLSSLDRVEEQVKRNEAWLDVPMKPFSAEHLDLDPNPRTAAQDYLRATFDLIVLALETDLTRVVTYMMGREDGMGFGDNFPKIALGLKKGHHTISHESNWEEWGSFDRWYAQQYAYFLDRLAEVRDEHGPLLDRTLTMYGSCCSTTHNARNLPLAWVGGKDLGIRHGRYERYGSDVPMSNLLLSSLHAVGVRHESFGDSTGVLPGLVG
ncbi:MAG: DUF1552 domain-containing protein [Planctomycetota bacterium]